MGCTGSKLQGEELSSASVPEKGYNRSAPTKRQAAPMQRRKALAILNAKIEKDLAKDSNRPVQKALFLGTGESGKSTVFKQMRLCYANSFDKFERYQYSKLIWADSLRAMRVLVDICDEELRSTGGDAAIQAMLMEWIGRKAPESVLLAKYLLQSLDTSRKGFLNAEADLNEKAFLHSHVAVYRREPDDLDKALISSQAAQPIITQAARGYASMGEFEEAHMGPLRDPINESTPTRQEIASAIETLWNSCPAPVRGMVVANQVGLDTNAAFFLDKIQVMRAADYLATDEDILRARIKTTGIAAATFRVKGSELVVMDVGGQRIERKKWIYGFDDVSCLLFVASVSEYDQSLDEESSVNRLDEALETFKQTVNSQWFRGKSVQLFLNKTDILEQKCRVSPFSNHFPDYHGNDEDPSEIIRYVEGLFRSRFKTGGGNRSLYVHQTCATDMSTMRFVVDAVSDMILLENMKWAGMI